MRINLFWYNELHRWSKQNIVFRTVNTRLISLNVFHTRNTKISKIPKQLPPQNRHSIKYNTVVETYMAHLKQQIL